MSHSEFIPPFQDSSPSPSASAADASRHRLAIKLLREGQIPRAVALLREELAQSSAATFVRHDLAVALASQGHVAEAVRELEQVVHEMPEFADAWGNLGKLLSRAGRSSEAVSALEHFVEKKTKNVEGLVHLSAACRSNGRFSDALSWLRQAITVEPANAELWLKQGVLNSRLQRTGDALASYREALRLKPEFPEALNNLGVLLREQGDHSEAIRHLQKSVQLRPVAVRSWVNLGIAFAEQKDDAEALRCYQEALKHEPNSHEAHNNLGNLLLTQNRVDEAVVHFQRAIQSKSDYAEAYNNLGLAFGKKGAMHQAIAFFDQALHYKPNLALVHVNKAVHCLAAGEFERGWAEYEWRWRTGTLTPRPFVQPLWDGAALQGRVILLHAEQGLGDTFMFIRYAALVRQRGGRVVVECPASLLRVLETCPGVDEFVARGNALPPFDVHAPLLSLARLLRTNAATIPQNVPYLSADASLMEQWKPDLAALEGIKVGIAWQGSPRYIDDASRSIPLQHFAPLAQVAGVTLVSLQKGPGEEQASTPSFPVHRFRRSVDSEGAFFDTAAIMKHVDLVITSDSAVAHLAGALGIPVWTVLSAHPDWRWLRDRDDTPWYPTMRLFRQQTPGSWTEVFTRVAQALQQRIGGVASTPKLDVASRVSAYEHAMKLVAQHEFGEAIDWFRQATQQQPASFDAWHNLGVCQVRKGQLDEAITSFARSLELKPHAAEAHNNLGLVFLQKRNYAEAITCFRRAIERKTAAPEFHNNLGTAQLQQKQIDDAIASYRKAIELNPTMIETFRNLGFAHRLKHQFNEARQCYTQALQLKPELAALHNDLGATFLNEGRLEDALPPLRVAIEKNPKLLEAWNNLGVALADLNRIDEAVETLEKSLEQVPGHAETHRNLAIVRLMKGDLERGFAEFEWRWQCPKSGQRNLSKPLWDGSDLEGKTILLHAEQGLGDTLQFIRYAPLVKARGGAVAVECQKPLTALLRRCEGIDHLVARGDPLPAFDVHAPLLSLPALLGTTLTSIPATIPYLFAETAHLDTWRQHLADWRGFKVGIAWQGNPKYGGDKSRSIPLSQFAALAEIPGVRFVSLQKGLGTEQIPKLEKRIRLLDLDRLMDNPGGGFLDTAGVIKNLDLVITSDTAITHLAGGLGVPTWVALCSNCDWRWLRHGDTSPWYPSFRLFRQERPGDWSGVFSRIAVRLRDIVADRPGEHGLSVPIAAGELLDKITILQIKTERMSDPQKLRNVEFELSELAKVRLCSMPNDERLGALTRELKEVNETLWQIEDEIRACEHREDFGSRFVELARAVYRQNDRRAAVKRRINEFLGSRLVEEKSYAEYKKTAGDPSC